MNLLKRLFNGKHDEIDKLKLELESERRKNLNDLRLLNKKFKAVISDMEVEFVIKKIDEVRREK